MTRRWLTSTEFNGALIEAGVLARDDLDSIDRLVIVSDIRQLVTIHVQRTADRKVLDLAPLLARAEVAYVPRDGGEAEDRKWQAAAHVAVARAREQIEGAVDCALAAFHPAVATKSLIVSAVQDCLDDIDQTIPEWTAGAETTTTRRTT